MAEEIEYTRLHITPLNPALLKSIIPSSVLPHARNISFHSIQTFPERGYGFVELPVMEAEKIKKKLSGSILKGTKIKIDRARPAREAVVGGEVEEEPERPKKEKKKRKRDELPGVDIGERQVKRGWTTPGKDVGKLKNKEEGKAKKAVIKSKYTTGPECLFKTVLPPNVASKTTTVDPKPETRKKKKAGKEAVVHEFAKTTKYATFLKGSAGSKKSKAVAEFVEGKGWVDEDGNLVEEEKISKRHKRKKTKAEPEPQPEPIAVSKASSPADSDEEEEASLLGAKNVEIDYAAAEVTQNMAEDSDESSSSNGSEIEDVDITNKQENDDHLNESNTDPSSPSSSDSSSDTSSSSSSEETSEPAETPRSEKAPSRPQSSSNGPALSIKIPSSSTTTTTTTTSTNPIHPLEALYKKPKLTIPNPSEGSAAAAPTFSFFGTDADSHDSPDHEPSPANHIQLPPLTPFTQRDFEHRGIRSAAPTPDTAHPSKRFVWPVEKDAIEEEGDEHEVSSPTRKGGVKRREEGEGGGRGEAESEFQKWFWENRGDVNRAWKKRRKVAAKEKRQRENRKRHDG